MSPDALRELDDDAIRLMAFRVWGYKQGEQVSLLIHLGDRLGLFGAMAGAGPLTADELAERTYLAPRWVREWLWGMAAAELVEHTTRSAAAASSEEDRFELTPAGRAVLVDEDSSLFFAAGAFSEPPAPDLVADLAECFRTGIGLPYDRLGPSGAHRTERMLGPWARLALVPVILPMLDDMTRPDDALAAVRGALRDDGTLLVKEIKCADTLEENRANPMLAMMLGFSITSCMSSATSEPDGMGLGTVGLPESRLRELTEAAGFTSVVRHDPGEPSNVYYEVRP
jgi:hypothetical protein